MQSMGKKFKTILTLGAIISLPMILISVMAYVFDISESKWFGWLSFLIFIATIVLVQRYYRINFYEGFVSYGKMFGGTLLMLLFASAIMFIYSFLFYQFIAPEQIAKMLDMAKINMYDQGLSSSQISKSVDFMTNYVFTPIALSITSLFSTFIQGLLIALITSIFTKKNADGFTEAMKGVENE